MQLSFLGAAGTVTGSKYLVTLGNRRCLVDCGLFQGQKALRLRNWDSLPTNPKTIDAVVLTHGYLDHSGYLSLLVKNGSRECCCRRTRPSRRVGSLGHVDKSIIPGLNG